MAASPDNPLTGGCLCGEVRYELTAEPHEFYHCHCSICRKCQGAVYLTYASVRRSGFRLLKGKETLSTYNTSPALRRRFCNHCGAHVFGEMDHMPDEISLSVGTLDDGADPGGREGNERHIFWESRCGWFESGDSLPKVTEFGEGAGS